MPGDVYDMEPMPELPHADGRVVDDGARCVTCDASLAGKLIDGACECGTTVEFSRFGPDGGDGRTPIAGDLQCSRCGYSLSGLRAGDSCPECAMSIHRSLRGNALVNSDPKYVVTLARGAFIAEWTVILNLLLIVGSMFIATSVNVASFGAALDVAMVCLNIASLIGWWMLSAPDPALGDHNPGQGARKTLRVALVLMILITVFNAVRNASPPPGAVIRGAVSLIDLLSLALPILWLVKVYASLAYLAALESRLTSAELGPNIAGSFLALNWSVALSVGIIVAAFIAPCFAIIIVLALFGCLLWFLVRYVGMLESARSTLKRASNLAGT